MAKQKSKKGLGSQLLKRVNSLKNLKSWQGLAPLAIFLITAIPTGTYLVINVPAFWAPDGGAHVARVFQIAEGGVRPVFINHQHGGGYGGDVPLNVVDLKNLELNIIGQSPAPPGAETTEKLITAQDKAQIARINNQKISKTRTLISYVNSAAYSPVAYAPSVLGVITGTKLNFNLGHTLLLAKLCSFAAFILCAGYGLFTLRRSQLKWAIMTVSLLPIVIFQTASITADSFLFSATILFSALIIKGLSDNLRLTVLDKILLFICVLLVPLIKSVYFPVVFLILFLPARHWLRPRNYWVWSGTALVISMIGFGIWSSATADVAASNGLVRGDTIWEYGAATVQRKYILSHPIAYIHVLIDSIMYGSKFYTDTFFGWLGFTYLPIPGLSVVSGFLALGLSVLLAGKVKFKKYASTAVAGIVAATILIIFTTLYVYYSPPVNQVVQGVQGRYFIPLTILSIAALAACLPKLRIQAEGGTTAKTVLTCLIIFCCVFSTLRYGLAITT